MIMEDRKLFPEGRDYWYQYININGYAYQPNDAGLEKLSKNIDISVDRLKKCINVFLSA